MARDPKPVKSDAASTTVKRIVTGGSASGVQVIAATTNLKLLGVYIGSNLASTAATCAIHLGTASSTTPICGTTTAATLHSGSYFEFGDGRGIDGSSGVYALGSAGTVNVCAVHVTEKDG